MQAGISQRAQNAVYSLVVYRKYRLRDLNSYIIGKDLHPGDHFKQVISEISASTWIAETFIKTLIVSNPFSFSFFRKTERLGEHIPPDWNNQFRFFGNGDKFQGGTSPSCSLFNLARASKPQTGLT